MASETTRSLESLLAAALPKDIRFTAHHVSSQPFSCDEIFPAPPNHKPEPTECESHFLSVSINEDLVQVFAVEVLIYTTETLTTIFVSKADSTGYLHLLNCPKGTPSPIKTTISVFLEHLINEKKRDDTRLVLSLFARAQDQYLFPGSIENRGKHVLDDRGLIRWWCGIFHGILQKYPSSDTGVLSSVVNGSTLPIAQAYLRVPGCDAYETRAFFPKGAASRWSPSDPLRAIGKRAGLPERCLIPRFPDDPKARFVMDLDEELPENGPQPQDSPEKNPHPGKWRSVRSLEQFWELMAFRQECSAGRLVGFLWAVFESAALKDRPYDAHAEDESPIEDGIAGIPVLPTPQESQLPATDHTPSASRPIIGPPPEPPLSPIPTSQIQLAGSQSSPSKMSPLQLPQPEKKLPPLVTQTKGQVILSEPAYTRSTELLDKFDYDTIEHATDSTRKFIRAIAEEAGVESWGMVIVGEKENTAPPITEAATAVKGAVSMLGAGLMRKKRRPATEEASLGEDVPKHGKDEAQALPMGSMRKKPKVQESEG